MAANKPVKTLNGRPTSASQLALPESEVNAEVSGGVFAKIKRAYKNLNLVLAGMYTGVTCYGVPHEEHTYSEKNIEEKAKE